MTSSEPSFWICDIAVEAQDALFGVRRGRAQRAGVRRDSAAQKRRIAQAAGRSNDTFGALWMAGSSSW